MPSLLVKRIAVTPKYCSLAKLDGLGLGVCTNASALGWLLKNLSIGEGEDWAGPLDAAMACNISRNSSPVLVGNPSVEWQMISVCVCSARWKRMANPRGFAFGSLSGIRGRPVESENRAVIGVDSRVT